MARDKKLAILAVIFLMIAGLTALWSNPLKASYGDPIGLTEETLETHVGSDFTLHADNYLLLNFHSSEPFTVNGEEAEEWDNVYSYYANYYGSTRTSVVFSVDGNADIQIVATGDEGGLHFNVWPRSVAPALHFRLAISFGILALGLALALIIKDIPPHRPKPRLQSQARYFTQA